jgi:hypothetical protein
MCDVLFIVQALLMPCNTLAESEKIMKFCSESILSMVSCVPPIANASAMNVDAILAILNCLLRPSFIFIDANPTNGLFSIFEPSVAKHFLVLFSSRKMFLYSSASLICLPSTKNTLAS